MYTPEFLVKHIDDILRIYKIVSSKTSFLTGYTRNTFAKKNKSLNLPNYRIITYNKVVNPEDWHIPMSKVDYVRPETFEIHLDYIRKYCIPVNLDQAIENSHDIAKHNKPIVSIVLLGGTVDHFDFAAPLLAKYSIPATFFLPTAFIGTDNLFLSDKIMLSLEILARSNLPLPKFSFFDDESYIKINSLWTTLEEKRLAVTLIATYMQYTTITNFIEIFYEIGDYISNLEDILIPRTFMSWQEIKELNSLNFVFGSLSHSHVPIGSLSKEDLINDLCLSYSILKQQEINITKVFHPPFNQLTVESLEALKSFKISKVLSKGMQILDLDETKFPRLLPSVYMYESACCTKSYFESRLLGLKIPGLEF